MPLPQMSPKKLKKLEKTLLEMKEQAKEDPVYFFETFLYTFNPKAEPYHWRFKPFPFQKRLIRDIITQINNGEDLYIEKCREMGATYTVLGVFIWMWLWTPAANFLIGSRKEDYVDNRRGGIVGNKEESLFGKIDYMLSRLPQYILPEGYKKEKHFNFMSLVNPENGNSISGESSNQNFSRGGRQKAILLDEFAFWENDYSAWGSTADTTNCRIVLTTPGIKPGKAKRLRFGKDGEKIRVITLPYNLDPRKTKKWLNEQRQRRSEEDFNREIMINWELSITGRVYREVTKADFGDYPFIENAILYCSGDYGLDGTAFLFWQINPKNGKARLIDGYVNEGQIIQFYFPLFGKPRDSKFEYTNDDLNAFDEMGKFPKAIHFGDVDVRKKSFVKSTSTLLELQKAGIYVQSITKNDFITRRDITKTYLAKGLEINENRRTDYIWECLKMYRYPKRAEDSQATTPIVKPIHDFACLSYDNRIRTLNGWKKIGSLVGKEFYVYGYSQKEKRLIPTKIKRCWKSGKNVPLIRVYLDNNRYIKSTKEHLFMLRSGKYIEAQHLKIGDSLMPFYERFNQQYISVFLADGSQAPEHRFVYSRLCGYLKSGHHIHHIDGNKTNNNPNNLKQLSLIEHIKLEKPHMSNSKMSINKMKKTMVARSVVKKCPVCGKNKLMSYKQIYCNRKCADRGYKEKLKIDRDRLRILKKCKWCHKNFMAFERQVCCSDKCSENRKKAYNYAYSLEYRRGNRNIPSINQLVNHKVIKIEDIGEKEDVYDIEVPETHNFVAEGVVLHNSHPSTAMEYFFLNYDANHQTSQDEPSWVHKLGRRLTSKRSINQRR